MLVVCSYSSHTDEEGEDDVNNRKCAHCYLTYNKAAAAAAVSIYVLSMISYQHSTALKSII